MTVHVPKVLQGSIHTQLMGNYPNEGGGFLLGQIEDGRVTVADVIPITNVFEAEEQFHRYAMTPQDWMRLEDEADARGLTMVGYFHSHPDSPAIPSEYDRVHALPNFVYIIVQVQDAQAIDTRVWQLSDDRSQFNERDLKDD